MNRKISLTIILLLFLLLFIYLLSSREEEIVHHYDKPAYVVESEKVDMSAVVLTEKAAERLGIQTIDIFRNQLTIPYSAVIYDVYGDTWLYVNPKPLVYVRKQIYVNSVDNEQVTLSKPLLKDTTIVTVGVPELSGVEHGIGQGVGGH